MLPLPDTPLDPLKLADWLELSAIASPGCNSSQGDLERALRRAALFEINDDEAVEKLILDSFEEIEQRIAAAGQAYPFHLEYGTLHLNSSWQDFPVYTFCLCLSYFGWKSPKNGPINPRKFFETVSGLAAEGFLEGKAIGFGHPRTGLPKSFSKAVTELCNLIGEGDGYKNQPSLKRKDDRLDLVAWKDFTDKLPSKLLMFGQCASGWDWKDKISELSPEDFCNHWMLEPPVSPKIKSLFIPHRIEPKEWKWVARYGGILFDRCRIAFWAHGKEENYGPYLEWSRNLLDQVAE